MEPQTLPLRDIHLPMPPGLWPLAPGWWLVLAVLLCLLLFLLYRQYRKRHPGMGAVALSSLQALRSECAGMEETARIQAISVWLRRAAMSLDTRDEVASLTGDEWLAYLDSDLKDKPFSQGAGQALSGAQYRPVANCNTDELLNLCERWLQSRQKLRGRKS